MDRFFAGDVERITEVQRIRLYQWQRYGFITPSIQVAQKTGDKNIYSRDDLYKIAAFKELIENGLHGKVAARLLDVNIGTWKHMHDYEMSKGSLGICLITGRRFTKTAPGSHNKKFSIVPGGVVIAPEHSRQMFADKIIEFFKEDNCDDVMIINLSNIIKMVEFRI
jgi:hypothetical protein